jgi:hypothetical protein
MKLVRDMEFYNYISVPVYVVLTFSLTYSCAQKKSLLLFMDDDYLIAMCLLSC